MYEALFRTVKKGDDDGGSTRAVALAALQSCRAYFDDDGLLVLEA